MPDERDALTPESLVKKLLVGERLTVAERELLTSSDAVMVAVVQRLASANGVKECPGGTAPDRTPPGIPEREAAARALQHGRAVLDREFPGLFTDSV